MRNVIKNFKFIFVVIMLLIPASAFAIPQIMSYQGKLSDGQGMPVSGMVSMTFMIYDVATGGTPLWTEPWVGENGVNVSNGIFNVALGSKTDFPPTLFDKDNLYLSIQVGSDNEMVPRQQIVSGSFAFKSKTVEYNVPIGTIMAWAKNLTGVPDLPNGWVECNGQKLIDADSPLNNEDIPNLNGNHYFLRGDSSPGTGGSDTHSHSVPRDGWGSGGSTVGGRLVTSGGSFSSVNNTTGASSNLPPYYNVVWIMKVK